MKKYLVVGFCLIAACVASAAADRAAADTWPARPVKMIVGFAPGGPTDLFARLIAQSLTEQTGKNFFIENVPGAGGNVGAVRVAQSPPDGYTLLGDRRQHHQQSVSVQSRGLRSDQGFRRRHGRRLDPGGAGGQSVGAGADGQGAGGWIRANPGKESFASPGTGTPPQLVGALFAHSLNLDLVHVPFGGGGPAVEATVRGHTPISFGALAPAVPLIKCGGLRALAVTGKDASADTA